MLKIVQHFVVPQILNPRRPPLLSLQSFLVRTPTDRDGALVLNEWFGEVSKEFLLFFCQNDLFESIDFLQLSQNRSHVHVFHDSEIHFVEELPPF